MTHNLRKKVLILGGTGLVGRNTIVALLDKGVRSIGVVGLKNDKGWKELEKIESNNKINIKKYKNNLLIPSQFGQHLFEKGIKRKDFAKLVRILSTSVKKSEIKKESLYKIISNFRPDFVIDSINTATQCAYLNTNSFLIDGVGVGNLMLLRYYQILFYLLHREFWKEDKKKIKISEYIKVGTTGIGGMGLDIPFTHGEEQPSLSLLKKVSMAGAQTNILSAIRNSYGVANIQEIVPATSVFQLSGFNTIKKEIDGGESRGYALEEFRLLTTQSQMGVIDARELAEIIILALEQGKSRHNTLAALEQCRITRSSQSLTTRRCLLRDWRKDMDSRGTVSVAHGNLGPWRTRKLLFELFIVLNCYHVDKINFWHLSPQKIQKNIMSVISKNTELQKEIKYANLRIRTSSVLGKRSKFDRYIDLSLKNIIKWRKTLQPFYTKKNFKFLHAGDILARLIEQRHDLQAIP